MKSKVIKKEKNPFLKREEIILEITSDSAPSSSDVMTELKSDEKLTVVKKINTNFGRQTFLAEAVVYDSPESKERIETIPQKVRKKMEADRKAAAEEEKKKAEEEKKAAEEAAAAAEAPKEEKEEPKEESKEESETKSEEKDSPEKS